MVTYSKSYSELFKLGQLATDLEFNWYIYGRTLGGEANQYIYGWYKIRFKPAGFPVLASLIARQPVWNR